MLSIISFCCSMLLVGHAPTCKVAFLAEEKVLVLPVDGHAVVVLGHGPEAGPVGLLVPVDRGLLAELGEPLMGDGVDEVRRVGEVDVAQLHGRPS